MAASVDTVTSLTEGEYKYGFVTDIEADTAPKGLNEGTVRFISAAKGEPEWLLEWRLKAYRHWLGMVEPNWARVGYPSIDYQDAYYYSAPKTQDRPKSLDEVDPELLRTYEKLGIPLREQEVLAGVAVDAVFDSVSVATTFKDKLAEVGVIFCSFSEAVQEHPDLVRAYLGTVVPYSDNYFATLNSSVFTDGSFVYVPKGVRCPMELSTYFRTNSGWSWTASENGQKMMPRSMSLSLKVVATETLSKTASTATPARAARSCSGMPSFSYVSRSLGSTSSRLWGRSLSCRGAE